MPTSDETLFVYRPSMWRYLRDHSLFVVIPVVGLTLLAFPETFTALSRWYYLLPVFGVIYLLGYVRFLFYAPAEIRITENRIDLTDRTDALRHRAIRFAEMQGFKETGGWSQQLVFRTYQDRTYRVPNLGIDGPEWKALLAAFRERAAHYAVPESLRKDK